MGRAGELNWRGVVGELNMTKTHCTKLSKNIKKGRNEKAKMKKKGKGRREGKVWQEEQLIK